MQNYLLRYFNQVPRIGVLATANREGKVNAAHFGSPFMTDPETVVMGLGENRTLHYLQENPHAVFIIVQPGETLPRWRGLRIYLEMKECSRSGELLEQVRSRIAEVAGQKTAKQIVAAVTFRVTEIRPLVDAGQGWEEVVKDI
jgi:hypothetical protein